MAKHPAVFTTTFGSYQVQELLGYGGSGTVYRVADDDGDPFAIKCLNPDTVTSDKRKRFKNELMFCLRNRHPNIVTVLDYGIVSISGNDRSFYVMHCYPSTLRSLMKQGISPDRVLPIFGHMLDGVEAAHLQSVVHRDLKPENILMGPASDVVVVADFGIAHFTEEFLQTVVQTKPQDRLANFGYAAPEQKAKGQPVDRRADIFALGLILNEMFTGEVLQGSGYRKVGDVAPAYAYLDALVDVMVRQHPEERLAQILDVKQQLIARGDEFVSLQKLSALQNRVVQRSEIEDPLVTEPVRLVSVGYGQGDLILHLSQPVSGRWIDAFRNISYGYAVLGATPANFRFTDDIARVRLPNEDQARSIVDHFTQYLELANRDYRLRLERREKQREQEERQRLLDEIQEEEKRQRILKEVRI